MGPVSSDRDVVLLAGRQIPENVKTCSWSTYYTPKMVPVATDAPKSTRNLRSEKA